MGRMIKSWVIDLRHFLLPEGKVAPLPSRSQRLFAYWTEIVSQATQYDDPTTLRCRRRPGVANPAARCSPSSSTPITTMYSGSVPAVTTRGASPGGKAPSGTTGTLPSNLREVAIVELDTDKIDQAVLALLSLGRHDGYRVWKGFDWAVMNRLHEKGYITDPVSKAHSVLLTEEGARESERLLRELFGRPRGGK
jgi:hypothetical protein